MLSFLARSSARSRPAQARLLSSTARARADPYVLPHTPAHVSPSSGPSSVFPTASASEHEELDLSRTDLPFPEPLARPGESVATLRARLVYQTRKRGTLESDLLMSTFAREHMGAMSEPELREFDKLLDENDWDTYYWATEKREPPARWADSPLLAKLKVHARNEGRVVRRMPDLHTAPTRV